MTMGRPKKEHPNHASGMYEVKVTVGKTFEGKLIRKSFYSSISKADAKAKAEQYKVNNAVREITGENCIQDSTTFETWSRKVLESLKGTVKDSTYHLTYKNSVENHLIPYFGKHRLVEIKQIDIQSYFNTKGKIVSLETLKKHKMALNRIFEAAMLNGIITMNPCIRIKLKSDIKPAIKSTYTKEQCAQVLKFATEHRFGLGVHLMLMYGLSRSELLGLQWDDVDWDNRIIHIQRGVTDVQDSVHGEMRIEIGELKNDFRKRDVPISSETAVLLRTRPNGSRFVICNANGCVCSPRTWSRRHYDVFMRDMHDYYAEQGIDIPKLNPHELRHTRATIWVNGGANLFAVADVLGHSDLKMLRKRYAHSDTESTRKMLDID